MFFIFLEEKKQNRHTSVSEIINTVLIIWNLSPQIKFVKSFCHPDKTMVYILYLNYCVVSFLVEETGVPEESTDQPQANDKLYHIILYQVHITMRAIRTHNFSDDCTGGCKSKTTIRSWPRRFCLYDLVTKLMKYLPVALHYHAEAFPSICRTYF